MNYGDVIQYMDGTFDENFNKAKRWAEEHKTTFEEDMDRRDLPKRYFVIGAEPKIEPEIIPELTIEEQNEVIRVTRERLYVEISDVIRNDYLEAVARGSENAEELKREWLESKDKIRAENPYLVKEVVDNLEELSDNELLKI